MKHKISLMLLSSSLAINSVLPVYALDLTNPNDITNTEAENLAVLRDGESSSDEISIITDMSNQELSSVSTIILNSYNEVYTGSQITPQVIIIPHVEGTIFQENIDYSVTYGENIEGIGSVTVTGMGSYTGSTSIEFNISSGSGGISTFGLMQVSEEVEGDTTETTPEIQIQELIDISSVATDVQVDYTDSSNYIYTGGEITPILSGLDDLNSTTDYYILYSNNTNASSNGVIIIVGMGDYKGTIVKNFTINPADISGASVVVDASYDYTGSAITPTPTVSLTLNGSTVTPTFTTNYGANTESGTNAGSITITGTGNFTGTASTTFTINKVSVDGASVTGLESSYAYTGSAITPEVTVEVNGRTLIKDTDYDVDYTSNIEVGNNSGVITITGKGNYEGTNNSTKFTIEKTSISGATISGIDASYTYTGDEIKPEPTTVVLANGKLLTAGTDYTISYDNNTALSTDTTKATIKITGIGIYTGEITQEFSIATADLSGATISGVNESYTYTGSAIEPAISVTLDGNPLTQGTDASDTNADYYVTYDTNKDVSTGGKVTITGINNYDGSGTSVDFTITPREISEVASITINDDDASRTYTGSQIIPTDVSITGVTSADYEATFTYGDNINVADGGTITITGKDNYTGTLTESFTITAKDIVDSDVSLSSTSETYTGYPIEPTVSVGSLVLNEDYTLTYSNNTNAGTTAEVKVEGIGNYANTVTKTFTITAKAISDSDVSGINASYTYDGNAITPEPVVIVDNKKLTKDTDYNVDYTSNTAIGTNTAEVKVVGTGNYSGTITKNFSIVANDLRDLVIEDIGQQTYDDGEEIKPTVTITGLTSGESTSTSADYYITYKNNVNVGVETAYAVATGINAYSGTIEKAFTITAKDIDTATIEDIGDEDYTGSEIKPTLTVKDARGNTL